MSRDQQTATYKQAKGQNEGYYNEAQNSYTKAQNDIGDYADQLAKYKSSNPFVQGGQFQKTTNQVLANTADAGARSAGEALQSQALRTGQNTAGGVAATEQMEQQGTRTLSAEEAAANQERIGKEAGYNANVLTATERPAAFEADLAGQQGRLAGGAAGIQEDAAKTPSWLDEFGGAFAQQLGKTAGGGQMSYNFAG